MRIKKIRLKNGYKRFHDLTIDLGGDPARIVALVGPNGSGKSSVLDGLLYYHQQMQTSIGDTRQQSATYHSMSADRYNAQDIEIVFDNGSYHEMRRARSQTSKPNTIFSFRSPYRYNTHVKINEIRSASPIYDNDYGAGDTSSLDSKMENNYRRLQAMINRYMDKHDARPSDARSAIISELNASIKKCLDLEICSVGNVEASEGTLYFSKSDHEKKFEFNFLSSGEKEVIDLLLDLYLRKDDYNDTVFLIDEPELHINTSIQGNLLSEIDRLVGQSCQIWLTTHSIGFLRALQTKMKGKCQIIQFMSDYKLASEPYTLTPMNVTVAAWRELFSVALDDLAALVSPKTIVYCEGRDTPGKGGRERGMDAQALNTIFGKTHPDTLFISSGGNTELDQRSSIGIAILSKAIPSIEILVLKDRDVNSSTPSSENDRMHYLKNNPQHYRIMKRFELENYLYDKDVLTAYCSDNDLAFDEEAYNDFVTDINNQNLKDSTGRIKQICNLKISINAETFKINLANYLNPDMPAFVELRDCIFKRT